jgi:hypothetical protein
MSDLFEKKKYPFKRGDWCRVGSPKRYEEMLKALCTNGYGGYVLSYESFMFAGSTEQERLNGFPYNDMLCLVRGRLPEDWCVECTDETVNDDNWVKLKLYLPSFHCLEKGLFYGIKQSEPYFCQVSFGTEILLSTWAAIQGMNEECQHQEHDIMTGVCGKCNADIPTLEQQVNEYKEQQQPDALICMEGGRILLKVDAQGFISIDGMVVGHEPGLPKFFTEPEYMTTSNGTKYKVRNHSKKPYIPNESIKQMELITEKLHGVVNSLTDFNLDLPFEVTNDDNREYWYPQIDTRYIGIDRNGDHVIQNEYDVFSTWKYIRNIKEPEFTENQPVWFKQRPNNIIWEFGFYKNGDVDLQGSGTAFRPYSIRPFFVNGVATYPPFES